MAATSNTTDTSNVPSYMTSNQQASDTQSDNNTLRQAMITKWQNMSPEQKADWKKNKQQEWQQASPAVKTVIKEKLIACWDAMSPADKKEVLNKMQAMMKTKQKAS